MHELKEVEFYGSSVKLFVNSTDVLVAAKSISNCLGIDWKTQYTKIKKCIPYGQIPIKGCGGLNNKAIVLHTNCLGKYLETINPNKFDESKRDRIVRLKKEFEHFVLHQAIVERGIELADYYLETKAGIKKLLINTLIKLGNDRAMDSLADMFYTLLNTEALSEEYLWIIDWLYDISETTALKQDEIEIVCSTSPSSRLERIARKLDNQEISLELKKIAKEIY